MRITAPACRKLYIHTANSSSLILVHRIRRDLRALQHGDELQLLLSTVMEEMTCPGHRDRGRNRKPVLVKIAPDMTNEQFAYTVETIVASGVNGIIATNTTLAVKGCGILMQRRRRA